MAHSFKQGKQIVDDFFNNLDKISNVDKNIVKILKKLHNENKLSDKNIYNSLLNIKNEEE